MHHCGIELASKSSVLCVLDDRGKKLREIEVPTTAKGFSKALKGMRKANCVVEASPLAEWAKKAVEALAHRCTIIDARAAKKVMEASKKTDRRDAHTLAELARTGFYRAVHAKSDRSRLWRTQLQVQQGLTGDVRRLASRIRGLCRAHGVRVGQVSAGGFVERVRSRVEEGCAEILPCLEPLLENCTRVRV